MKYNNIISDIRTFLVVLVASFGMFGCSDDEIEVDNYGYVQFRLYKEASYDVEKDSRAVDRLQYLSEAKKIAVHFQSEKSGFTISQTLVLNSYNDENAEFGLSSDKLKLLVGTYKVIGYDLYNNIDEKLISVTPSETTEFDVVSKGMTIRPLSVKTVQRGMVSFKLVKNFLESRAAGAYCFGDIKTIDIVAKNNFTGEETEIKKVRVKHYTDFEEGSFDEELYPGKKHETSYAICDTTVWLKAGTYKISRYVTYSDKKAFHILEVCKDVHSKEFQITDNAISKEVEVPIKFAKTDERIKDYLALKEIWLALNGPEWSYFGESHPEGANWNFNKDIDLWGEQPGITLNPEGRVGILTLDGMGAKGVVPAAIGQLTKLHILSLGSHSEKYSGKTFNLKSTELSDADVKNIRNDYKQIAFGTDYRTWLSDAWQQTINVDPTQKPIVKNRFETKAFFPGTKTNGITGVSKAILRCTELIQLYIANGLIDENFIVDDITPDSPFYKEKDSWKWENMDKLTDIELFNCQNLKALPIDMLANLPQLQLLNIAANRGISGETLLHNWEQLAEGKVGSKIQILYLNHNRLKAIPETKYLKKMSRLGMLDCSNNEIEEVHCFGKGVTFVNVSFRNNKIKKLPAMPAGRELTDDEYFFGYSNELETLSFANNQIEVFPDMFNTRSVFTMGAIDFSDNMISKFENEETFRGINASQLHLGNNRLDKFPSILFTSNSPLRYLVLSGNKLTEIPEGTFKKGSKLAYLEALDLSFNKLKKLPRDFNAENIPYLSGLELSYNSFERFPYEPLNIFTLSRLFVRNQRDSEGNRCLKDWPKGIGTCPSLRYLFVGSNDLRKIDDKISPSIFFFDIKDNPNISIDLTNVCPYIERGMYMLSYDKTQDIRGCDALDIQ